MVIREKSVEAHEFNEKRESPNKAQQWIMQMIRSAPSWALTQIEVFTGKEKERPVQEVENVSVI